MICESNLLLVEDDIAVRQSLTRVLATENYKVFGASSCHEAILLYTQNQIDVVLLDLNLDPEDGWEVFHKLKELRADLPIVVTSGQPQRFAHASAHRADGILEKPFDPPVLFGLLENATMSGLLGLSNRRTPPRPLFPRTTKRPRLERIMRTLAEPAAAAATTTGAPAMRLLIPPYWLFIYPWRAVIHTFRALFRR